MAPLEETGCSSGRSAGPAGSGAPRIHALQVAAYRIPTDAPESDGTLAWDSTTIVVVQAHAADRCGVGYSYTHPSAALLIRDLLAPVVQGRPAMDIPARWSAMRHAVRNIGRPGLASAAIAAVDTALWDLKARLLELPLVTLLGAARDAVPIYGSGGFTSYSIHRLQEQLAGWAAAGIPRVKMKVGREPRADIDRVRAVREAVGDDVEIFVDANGAYSRKRALFFADAFAQLGVSWFEEPVSSDDLDGLRLLVERAPAGMDIAAGEYGYDLPYFRRLLHAGAVDVLQADITRCGGASELLRVAALCEASSIDLSGHTAPMLHLHVACASSAVRHLEYFHDHVRIERILFDGAPEPEGGALRPDLSRPGNGFHLKRRDAEHFLA